MNKERRQAIFALLTGALAGLMVVAARKGFPGANKMATRLAKPMQPTVKAETYGYKEIKLS